MDYTVHFNWDKEAGVWIAASDDIPGLVLESGSFDALLEQTRFAVPELLSLNSHEDLIPMEAVKSGLVSLNPSYPPLMANGNRIVVLGKAEEI